MEKNMRYGLEDSMWAPKARRPLQSLATVGNKKSPEAGRENLLPSVKTARTPVNEIDRDSQGTSTTLGLIGPLYHKNGSRKLPHSEATGSLMASPTCVGTTPELNKVIESFESEVSNTEPSIATADKQRDQNSQKKFVAYTTRSIIDSTIADAVNHLGISVQNDFYRPESVKREIIDPIQTKVYKGGAGRVRQQADQSSQKNPFVYASPSRIDPTNVDATDRLGVSQDGFHRPKSTKRTRATIQRPGTNGRGKIIRCPFEECNYQGGTLAELERHKIKRHDFCKLCDLEFASFEELHLHKVQTAIHVFCVVCSEDFTTTSARDRHILLNHPTSKDLPCIGCAQNYNTISGLMSHLESGECHAVRPEMFVRAQKLYGNLAQVKEGEKKKTGGQDQEKSKDRSDPQRDTAFSDKEASKGRNDSEEAHSRVSNEAESLANGQQLSQSKHPDGDWVVKYVEHLDGDAATKRARDLNRLAKTILGPLPPTKLWINTNNNEGSNDSKDPLSFDFKLEWCRNPKGTFSCPYAGCVLEFIVKEPLGHHILCPRHMRRDFCCPMCGRVYKSAAALVSHMESTVSRCLVRDAVYFKDAMAIATGGFLALSERMKEFLAEANKSQPPVDHEESSADAKQIPQEHW